MTAQNSPTVTATDAARPYDQVLADAVRVMTEAARLTVGDWAEFVTQALAGAAANVGGIEVALKRRPGSWEADYVRNLLTSTVGHDSQYLLEHRTEPLVIDVYVDELLCASGSWAAYDEAQQELHRRSLALGEVPWVNAEQIEEPWRREDTPAGRAADAIEDLEERLEQQRLADWERYGQQIKAHIEAAADARTDLRVPVIVNIDLDTFPAPEDARRSFSFLPEDDLLDAALAATALPGAGQSPLERLDAMPERTP